MPTQLVTKEDIEVLAYRLYKSNQPYDKMIWRLAELCETIKKTIGDVKFFNADAVDPLSIAETLHNDVKLVLKKPTDEEIRASAEKLYGSKPAKAELHWFIAEKTLLLKKLLELYGNGSSKDF